MTTQIGIRHRYTRELMNPRTISALSLSIICIIADG
jgi:hypothetical protein